MQRKMILTFIAIFLLLSGCTSATTESPPATTEADASSDSEEGISIVFGDISDDPGEVIEGAQPMADYLAGKLADYGVTKGEVKVAASIDEMAQFLENGEVDLYFDSVYPATLISDQTGAKIVLRRWRFGVEEYYSVIFASKESGITSIDQLKGQVVAMDSPYSTSGFALPSVYLLDHGLTLQGKSTYNDAVAEDEVGFIFSFDDENTLTWVLEGLVAAGVTDDFRYDVLFENVQDQLVELARTEGVPRQVMVVRPGMDPELLQAIIDILTSAHEDEEAAAALESYQTTQFDEFPEGLEAAVEQMRTMMDTVLSIPTP